jgi:subtilisin family serine protease
MDESYEPVPVAVADGTEKSVARAVKGGEKEAVLIRGEVEEDKVEELKGMPGVLNVWDDGIVMAFGCGDCPDSDGFVDDDGSAFDEYDDPDGDYDPSADADPAFDLELSSPCSPTDCASGTPKGTIADVAKYLRVDRLWSRGIRGRDVVIGIVDSGVNKTKVPAFIGGWSPTPGYTPGDAPSSSHGTMCAFDASGMAPDARIYDIALLQAQGGISGLLSDAVKAFQWAIDQYKADGTPQILSNSWGMFQQAWAPDYATNPNHPVTRKVVEAIDTGIIVLFAAGNCGSQCPSGKCGSDTGPGKSIWGANGHPMSITVGAANIREEWIGYTSQGPAALDPKKPDFCAPSHFTGARTSDNGTSAACPICAGVVALYRSHDPNLRQGKVKKALQKTAKNLCASGWDPHSGYGMIQGERAFNHLVKRPTALAHAMWVHGTSVQEEFPDRLENVRRLGPYSLFDGKPGTSNWFHFAIPTPVIVDNRRLRLESVMLQFLASRDTWVTNVHIYDGYQKIEWFDGLAMTGYRWFERFDTLNPLVRFGIGVSVRVRFGRSSVRHHIRFVSAGGDFI